VYALVFHPNGELLASGGSDRTIKLWSLSGGDLIACLMDLAANEKDVLGITYLETDSSGQKVQRTLPCGSSIPTGAVCVCNCVAGSYVAPACSCVGHTVCSCDGHTTGGCSVVSHYWHPN
jgi:hypothetical protein